MKVRRRLLLPLLIAFLAVPSSALALEARSAETVTVPPGETLNEDLYATGETVTIAGTVTGDVIVASGKVFISGTVNGSVWAAASQVSVSGTVAGSVRAVGSEVTVSGGVGRDLLAAGSEVRTAPGGRIGGDALVAGSTVAMAGPVAGDLKAAAERITLSGSVGGNASTRSDERLQLQPGAAIAGSLEYRGSEELARDPGATVGGPVKFIKQESDRENYFDRLGDQLYWFLAAVLLLLAILLYARRAAQVVADQVFRRPGWSLLTGLAFVLLTPLLMLVLLVTLVGIPLSLMTGVLYLTVLYTAKSFVALAAGQALLRRRADSFWVTFGAGVIGLTLLYALAAIPVLGGFVTVVTVLLGTGAQLLFAKQFYADHRKKYGA